MRDFPVFATEHGVSSLTLREIPYRGTAYIQVGSVSEEDFPVHLKECVDFCRTAGADRIYAAGDRHLEGIPIHSEIWKMQGRAWTDPEKEAQLFPVTEKTVSKWRELYNSRMASVDHAKTLERRDEKNLAKGTGAYFVHQGSRLLGIGLLDDCKLLAMASVVPGAGETIMHTLMSLLEGELMTLEVASTNTRAVSLYGKLGFCKTEVLRSWYEICPDALQKYLTTAEECATIPQVSSTNA